MGRLFWKFFLLFWLAQVFTSFGVGLAIWASRPDQSQGFGIPRYMPGEPPEHRLPPHEPDFDRPQMQHHGGDLPPNSRPNTFIPLLPIVAGSVVSLVFAAWLAWYFARPIRNLRSAFDSVANGKLGTRIGLSMGGRHDELADLSHDFDRMATQLQALMESHQRLLHDISHELRSPLARLQAATDLMQQQPERAEEFIARLERDTRRIDTLVGELLMLARVDSGLTGCAEELVDLNELIDHIVGDARFEAEQKQCTVEVDMPDRIPVKGNQELLFRALENVIRNAVLHSPAGKRVSVAVTQEASGAWRVSVADEGAGVPPSELETIFQPFFRSKAAVSYAGYGLGLAITQRVVQAHGGKVTAANGANCGLVVTIELPAVMTTSYRA